MSPPMPLYCIDTCSILDRGSRGKYPHELFPSLWARIDGLIHAGRLRSSEEVLLELGRCTDTEDPTHAWATENRTIFVPTLDVQEQCIEVLGEFPRLCDIQSARSQGDPWLIATARKFSYIVVTEEKAALPRLSDSPDDVRKTKAHPRPKIPDVCRCMRVPCLDLIGLMRR